MPPLTSLTLDTLAQHADGLTSLRGIDIHLCTGLLYRIMKRGTLDYRLACIFRDSGHPDIAAAITELNLLDAIPTCAAPRLTAQSRESGPGSRSAAHTCSLFPCRHNSIPRR